MGNPHLGVIQPRKQSCWLLVRAAESWERDSEPALKIDRTDSVATGSSQEVTATGSWKSS